MDIQKQSIENIDKSTINQAGRDLIITGLNYKDVKDICRDVVREEYNIASKVALERFKKDVEEYSDHFSSKLKEEANSSELIQKFQNPELNFILHNSIRSYSSISEKEQKEIIVETMIDRLKYEETDIEKFIVDDAISILPRINKRIGLLLVAMFRRGIMDCGISFVFEEKLKTLPEKITDILRIKSIDLSYSEQLGCIKNLSGTKQFIPYEEILLKNHDLYFRKYPSPDEFEKFIESHPAITKPIIPITKEVNVSIFIRNAQNNIGSVYHTNIELARKYFSINADQEFCNAFEEFLKIAPVMSVEDANKHLIGLNPKWEALLTFLNSEKIRGYDLSPAGRYIANIIYSKLFHTKKMLLSNMY